MNFTQKFKKQLLKNTRLIFLNVCVFVTNDNGFCLMYHGVAGHLLLKEHKWLCRIFSREFRSLENECGGSGQPSLSRVRNQWMSSGGS